MAYFCSKQEKMVRRKRNLLENVMLTSASTIINDTEDSTAADLSEVEKIGIVEENEEEPIWKKYSFKKLNNRELLEWEKMAFLVCQRIERGISQYNGGYNTTDSSYIKFTEYNYLREKIIDEMQKRIEWRAKHEKVE